MKEIKDMTNHELGMIASAFYGCEKYEKCADCPCEGVLCGREDFGVQRELFMCEVGKRLMEKK